MRLTAYFFARTIICVISDHPFVTDLFSCVTLFLFGMLIDTLQWGIIGCGVISADFAKAIRMCQRPNKVCTLL